MSAPVRVGIIGTGFGALVHAPVFHACPGAEVAAICSRRAERAREAGRELGLEPGACLDDYREMVNLPALELVCVATPPELHHPVTRAALEAGKHVLCEKPFALDAAQACDLLRAAEEVDRLHFLNFEFRTLPARRELARRIAAGDLGDILQVNVVAMVEGTRFPVLNRWGWWHAPGAGGGWLGAMGSHYIDMVCSWLGDVRGVACHLETAVGTLAEAESGTERPVATDDGFLAWLRMQNGALVSMTSGSRARRVSSQRIEVYGSHGSAVLENDRELHVAVGDAPFRAIQLAPVQGDGHPSLAPMRLWAREIVGAVRDGKQLSPSFEDGLRCRLVMDAMHRSHDAGGAWVRVDSPLDDGRAA